MAMRKFQYSHPSSLFETATYNYNGRNIDVPSAILCPDCRTPVAWVEDDMTVSRVYHDPTCIQVKLGQGQVAPTREEPRKRRKESVWPLEIDIANAKREDDA